MKNNCLHWAFLCVASVIILGCSGPSQDWNGTWKLIPSRSSIPGPSFTITIAPTGDYQIDNGTYSDMYRCDGKEYPLVSGYTMSCVQRNGLVIDSTAKKNGVVATTAHWQLSADGKSLVITLAAVQSNAPAKTKEVVYQRMSGSAGFVGGWSDANRLETLPQLLTLTLRGRNLHYAFSEKGQYADLLLDGPEAAWHGPDIPPGVTVAIKTRNRRELDVVRGFQGRVVNLGSIKISADGRTLIEEFWNPDRTDLKTVLVYEKQ